MDVTLHRNLQIVGSPTAGGLAGSKDARRRGPPPCDLSVAVLIEAGEDIFHLGVLRVHIDRPEQNPQLVRVERPALVEVGCFE